MLTDWVMIVITAISVIATIIMCYFNYHSVKCAQEQMTEMKKQNAAEKRWKMMPFMRVKKIDTSDYIHGQTDCFLKGREINDNLLTKKIKFEVENVGHDVAKEIRYEWCRSDGRNIGYIHSLPVGDKRIVEVSFYAYGDKKYEMTATLEISYFDLIDNPYKQFVNIYFSISEDKIEFRNTSIEAPKYIEERE